MRPAALLLTAAALAAAGCGDDDEPRATSAPAANPGLSAWVAYGCGSCHTLAAASATGTLGPSLDDTLTGKSKDYILESIVAPDAKIAADYGSGMMPDDFAAKIPRAELDALAEFLLRAAGG